jgi:hypothetical protein
MNDLPAYAATVLLLYVILPVWILAGLADYFCHRATSIEKTSGTPESLLHLLGFGLVGVPTVLALFAEINATFFLVAISLIVCHHSVVFVDLHYANHRRAITPIEQMIHSFLEMLPITAFLLLAVLHWHELLAVGQEIRALRFDLHLKSHPLPIWYVGTAIGSAILFNLLPYFEELVRCLKARDQSPQLSNPGRK